MSKIDKVKCQMSKINKVKCQMSKINKVKCQMSKINKVNFDGAYLRSSSGHFYTLYAIILCCIQLVLSLQYALYTHYILYRIFLCSIQFNPALQ